MKFGTSQVKILAFSAAIAGVGAFVAPAEAAFLTFTNQALWQAAAGTSSLETFGSAAVGVSTADFGPTAFTGFSLSALANGDNVGIATNTIANGGDDSAIPAAFTGQNFYGWGNVDGNNGPTSTFTFAAGTTAFAFDWFNTDVTDINSITIDNGGGSFNSPPFGTDSSGFWGIVATGGDSFTSAVIQTIQSGGYVSTEGLDNVRVSAAAAPEPATLSLIGLGLTGLGWATRRRRSV